MSESPPSPGISRRELADRRRARNAEPPDMPDPYRNHSIASCVAILEDETLRIPIFNGEVQIEFNEMAQAITINRSPLEDAHYDAIAWQIENRFTNTRKTGLQFNRKDIYAAMEIIARRKTYHPTKEYLRSRSWDGTSRIAEFAKSLRLDDDPLTIEIIRRWLISAVARPLRPGCKVDTSLVLVGDQGWRKSGAFKALLPNVKWFSDTAIDFRSKDSFQALSGLWILEFAELEALARSRDSDQAKAFLSSTSDRYRPPYGRNIVDVPRSCVIVGSTNSDGFLTDTTGNRRYWTLQVKSTIDTDWIENNRDHLWAEAVALFDAGERWYLDANQETELRRRQEDFESADPWDAPVRTYVRGKGNVTMEGVLAALDVKADRQNVAAMRRVAGVLRRLGYRSRKMTSGARFWSPPNPTDDDSSGDGKAAVISLIPSLPTYPTSSNREGEREEERITTLESLSDSSGGCGDIFADPKWRPE